MSKAPGATSQSKAVYAPATVASQRGGLLFDRVTVSLSTSRYIPSRLVESSILLAEVFLLNVPEWILGEKNGGRAPVEKRIANSIAASRQATVETLANGGRRKVAVITGNEC